MRSRSIAAVALSLGCLATTVGLDPARAPGQVGSSYSTHAVAADHPVASRVGLDILRSGGSAADAAVATMLALGVLNPGSSGLGGGGFALYYRASDRSLTFLDFRERAPAAATPEMFAAREGDSEQTARGRSRVGGLAVGVPGEAAGAEMLAKRFGKLPWRRLVQPAERLARRGFAGGSHLVKALSRPWATALFDDRATRRWPRKPAVGDRFVSRRLANTLRTLADEGSQAFYRGAIARRIVARVRAAGGILSARDLSDYRVVERDPLRGRAFGFDWATAPPPSAGGYTILASLRLLERWLPRSKPWASPLREHALIESWKGAFLDRQRYFGDPDHVEVPMEALQSESRLSARAALFTPQFAFAARRYELPLARLPAEAKQPDNAGTSHLCVVDAEGNVAAVTTTINLGFGARFTAAGMWMNNEMDDFAREVGRDNAFGLIGGAANLPGPGKRPVSSMSPTIVFKGDAPVLCVGGSGGSRILTSVQQVALHVLLGGDHPADAVLRPRLHHQASPSHVEVTAALPEALERQLTARGHVLKQAGWSAKVQAIAIGGEPRLRAASDPGKGGEPRGE